MQLIESAAASLPLLSALPRLRVDLPSSYREAFARLEHCRLAVKFGQTYANDLRHQRPRPGDKWHLDEVFITIGSKTHYL